MAASKENVVFSRDKNGVGSYYKITNDNVAYSVQLSDLIIADYNDSGEVRGIEFVGKQNEPIQFYINEAKKHSEGPMPKSRGKNPNISGHEPGGPRL